MNEETFGSAFAAARKGGKETFSFGGKTFTTQKKGESSDAWKSSLTPAVPVKKVVPAARLDRSKLVGSSVPAKPAVKTVVPQPGGISPSDTASSSMARSSNPVVSATSRSTSTVAPENTGKSKPTRPVPGITIPKVKTAEPKTVDVNLKPKMAYNDGAKYAADTLAKRMSRMDSISKMDVVKNMGKPAKPTYDLQGALDAKAKTLAASKSSVKVSVKEEVEVIKELSTAIIDRYRRAGNESLGGIVAGLFSHDPEKKAAAQRKEATRMKSLNIADAKLGKGGKAKISGKD